ncbi:MAG: DUF4393 domain-containing protein, partial [Deltaproteobacteria bacterium]|nr:DUF4393 domain-containing protein [Deltaproteobacteria bacterium]
VRVGTFFRHNQSASRPIMPKKTPLNSALGTKGLKMVQDLAGAGKIAEATERGTREFRELIKDLLSPSANEIGECIADKVRIYRFKSTVRAIRKAQKQIKESGLSAQPIQLKHLIPMLEGASLEEDDGLTSKWAGLIASAVTKSDVLPAFAEILRQLSPEEARMLDFMFDNASDLPGIAGPAYGVDKAKLQSFSGLSQQQFLVRIQNLHRLELIVQLTHSMSEPIRGFRGWGQWGTVGLTALGEAFVTICRGPEKNGTTIA